MVFENGVGLVIIAIDFDGTCVEHMFPDVGPDVPGAVEVLRWLARERNELVLFTMRSGRYLDAATEWFFKSRIPLTGVQYAPNQTTWTASNKCYAQIYIDDCALGAPLIYPENGRPYLDWSAARLQLEKMLGEGDRNPVVDLTEADS